MLGIVLEYDGYWADEPGNGDTVWVNLVNFSYITAYKRDKDDKKKILEFAMHFPGNPIPFVISADQMHMSPPLSTAKDAGYGEN